MNKAMLLSLAGMLALAGCVNKGSSNGALIPNVALQLTSKVSVSPLTVAAAAAIYLIYDPLAPNWEIEEARLSDDTYRFSMKMKRYHTGGSGESIQILKRRAAQLQAEQGFGSYQIVEYSEGIDSETIGARRVAEGMIRLVQPRQADSFLMN